MGMQWMPKLATLHAVLLKMLHELITPFRQNVCPLGNLSPHKISRKDPYSGHVA